MDDYLEILDFFSFDVNAASEHLADRSIYTPELMERIMEDSCVDKIPAEPDRA